MSEKEKGRYRIGAPAFYDIDGRCLQLVRYKLARVGEHADLTSELGVSRSVVRSWIVGVAAPRRERALLLHAIHPEVFVDVGPLAEVLDGEE